MKSEDYYKKKTCRVCGRKMYYNHFVEYKHKNGRYYIKNICKECNKQKAIEYYKSNKQKANDTRRKYEKSEHGKIKKKFREYLYNNEKYKQSMNILKQTGEWSKIQKEYTTNFVIFQTDWSLENKLKYLNITEKEYNRIYLNNRPNKT